MRCKVNFEALDFVPHLKNLGDIIVQRMRLPFYPQLDLNDEYRQESIFENHRSRKFVALHLRFDKVGFA